MIRIFLVIFFSFFLSHSPVKAQLLDTIEYSLKKKPRFFLTLASHNTFIDRQFANIGGLRMGLAYNQRIRFGLGFFSLTNNAVVSEIHISEDSLEYDTNGNLHLTFISLSTEYIFFRDYPWQCTVTPFQLGIGSGSYEYIDRPEQTNTQTPSELVVFYQPEVSAQYNIFQWLGVGVTTGYRFTVIRSNKSTKHLSAPTFALDIRVFIDEIYKMLFKNDKNEE